MGQPVGVLANDCWHLAGAMTAAGAQKTRRFIELCDTFHLPIVSLVDEPGFMIGADAEKAGTIRFGAAAVLAAASSVVPWASVIVRKAHGVAVAAHFGPDGFVVAWPSAEMGALPVEGGVAVAFGRQIARADDPAAERKRLEEAMLARQSPEPRAESFSFHDLIDPRETRPVLCDWIARVAAPAGAPEGANAASRCGHKVGVRGRAIASYVPEASACSRPWPCTGREAQMAIDQEEHSFATCLAPVLLAVALSACGGGGGTRPTSDADRTIPEPMPGALANAIDLVANDSRHDASRDYIGGTWYRAHEGGYGQNGTVVMTHGQGEYASAAVSHDEDGNLRHNVAVIDIAPAQEADPRVRFGRYIDTREDPQHSARRDRFRNSKVRARSWLGLAGNGADRRL